MEEKVYAVFHKLKIPFEVIDHPALFKSSDRVNVEIDFKGATCCKNLLLKDKKDNQLFLISLPIDKKANLKILQEELGTSRLEFASKEELVENLGIKSGNASVLNIIEKQDTGVKFVIDNDLLQLDSVCFHPNVNTASIKFSPLYIEKILKKYNANYVFLEV
ncbi:MAG: YbaK/EbsC family protein [Clostridia bacterium]|nr:YbaK/EbsC family protein [Clostridia bacterium]